jgi:membrane protein DedA with SNARE-associated domain
MDLQNINNAVTVFVRAHEHWAVVVVLLLAFGESLAFISLLLPATVILFALGGLIGASELSFWPLWAAAVVGAFLGDWLSFWLGQRFGPAIAHLWPLNRHPLLLVRGHAFFERWGALSVFFGRFFGPLRASVPLVAGICGMPKHQFQAANLASALVWATGILAPGSLGLPWLMRP